MCNIRNKRDLLRLVTNDLITQRSRNLSNDYSPTQMFSVNVKVVKPALLFFLLFPLCAIASDEKGAAGGDGKRVTNVRPQSVLESQHTVIPAKKKETPRPILSAPSSKALRLVKELEAEQGPYSGTLGESLLSLGVQLQKDNDHTTAVEVLDRAMHTQRINEGLYSLEQVKVIERLIESHIAMGDWKAATKRHQHIYWLHQRNFGQNDPRMLPVIEKLSLWHLNAFSLNASAVVNHLLSAYHLFKVAVQIIDKNYGTDDLRLVRSLKGLALSNYYLATIDTSQNKLMPSSKNSAMESESRARLDQYILNSYYNGKEAITRIMNVYQSNLLSDTQKAIETKVQLGDWYMMFNRPYSAINIYQEAYELMQSTDDKIAESSDSSASTPHNLARSLFGTPKALPDDQLYGNFSLTDKKGVTPETLIKSDVHHYVVAKFDVTERGNVRNIKIVETSEDIRTSHKVKAKQRLKNRLFRPRFAQGKPLDTKDLLHKFIFTPAI